MTTTLLPAFGPGNAHLPPLPVIHSEAIHQQVFTHRSFHARPTHVFEDRPDDLSPDNEKFEHLGDSVLNLVVTGLMFDLYPGLHVGPSTKIRALVVGNSTLAEMSLRYRLTDRLRLHRAQAITLKASTHVQADVFESFIGGLYRDQGLEAVKAWLHPLLIPYLAEAYRVVRGQHGLAPAPASTPPGLSRVTTNQSSSSQGNSAPGTPNSTFGPEPGSVTSSPSPVPSGTSNEGGGDGHATGHLALFNQYLQKTNREIEWVYKDGEGYGFDGFLGDIKKLSGGNIPVGEGEAQDGSGGGTFSPPRRGTKTTPVWYVTAYVGGEDFGSGKGTSKKAARHEAAKKGLVKLGIVVW